MLSETKGKRLGTLRCCGLKPPIVRGHAAAFTYWFNVLGTQALTANPSKFYQMGPKKLLPMGIL